MLRGGRLDNATAMDALAEVLGALAVAEGGPLRLVGYSLGGRMALQLAAMHPALFSGVAVISGSAGLRGEGFGPKTLNWMVRVGWCFNGVGLVGRGAA